MVDVTLIGAGTRIRDCGEVLTRSGFSLARSFEVETGDRSPIILGEVQGAYQLAREAVESGRHLLIAATQALTPERLTLLLEHRRQAQALFVWSERRHHPGYRLLGGLIESDNTWRPRYLRQEMLSTETPNSALFRWRTLESIALFNSITRTEPRSVNATAIFNAKRNTQDLASLSISYREVETQLLVGLGEPVNRREMLMASVARKAYVDELSLGVPVRIVDDEPMSTTSARWLPHTSPTTDELARQQCIAFLEATIDSRHTSAEAAIWNRSLAALASMEQSLASRSPAEVIVRAEDHRFRVVPGFLTSPPSVA